MKAKLSNLGTDDTLKPSEMTDDELQLEIAELSGWEFLPYPDDAYKEKRHWWRSPVGGMKNQFGERWFLHLPLDWPTDKAAAIGLLDEMRNVTISRTKIDGDWLITVIYDPTLINGYGKNKLLSRAISEAFVMAMRAAWLK